MIRRKIGVSVALFVIFGIGVLYSQNRDLDREVDVSKEYVPKIERGAKPKLKPKVEQAVQIKSRVDYSVSEYKWGGGFDAPKVEPMVLGQTISREQRNLYVKAGLGAPLQSHLDLYFNSKGEGATFGGYLNHDGRYGSLRNELGVKARADEMRNGIGFFMVKDVGRRATFEADLGYDHTLSHLFGATTAQGYTLGGTTGFVERYMTGIPRIKLLFGCDFRDLTKFNYLVGINAYYLLDTPDGRLTLQKPDNKELGVGAFVRLGRAFGKHRAEIKLAYDGYFGGADMEQMHNHMVNLEPMYTLETERFLLRAGAGLVFNSRAKVGGDFYVLPQFEMEFGGPIGAFIPYVQIHSKAIDNSYKTIREGNPYFVNRTPLSSLLPEQAWVLSDKITRNYDFRVGAYGKFAPRVTYRLYGGVSLKQDPLYFVSDFHVTSAAIAANRQTFQSATLGLISDSREVLYTGGLGVEARISKSVETGIGANIYSYSLGELKYAGGAPNYDVSLFVKYSYRDKFSAKLSGKLIGERYMIESLHSLMGDPKTEYKKYKPAFVVDLDMEYRLNKRLSIYLEGQNLANSKAFRFNGYREWGVGFQAGVKFVM